MNTLFGNNAVNTHENVSSNTTNPTPHTFRKSFNDEQNMSDGFDGQNTYDASSSPTSGLPPIDFDSIPDWRSIEYKDGHIDSGADEDWIDRKKCTMAEITDQPIVVRSIHERNSKLVEGNKYISINFVNAQGEECFANTSGNTIKRQIEEKNMQFPFKTVIKACPKKDNPTMKYYKLS